MINWDNEQEVGSIGNPAQRFAGIADALHLCRKLNETKGAELLLIENPPKVGSKLQMRVDMAGK